MSSDQAWFEVDCALGSHPLGGCCEVHSLIHRATRRLFDASLPVHLPSSSDDSWSSWWHLDSTFLSGTQANLLAMWHLLGQKRSNFQISKKWWFLSQLSYMGSFGHKALKPSRGLGSASWPQCFYFFQGVTSCVAQAVGEVFAEANFKGQKG
jgi:hypothetical protein